MAKSPIPDYPLLVRFLSLVFLFCFSLPSQATTWSQAQRSRDYLAAKKHLADFLPDLAIPKIKSLLSLPQLDNTAKTSLLTLLGEAQVRAALEIEEPARTQLLSEALKTLDDRSLREFSPAHLWRSYALSNLGRLRDAVGELKRIDRLSMRDQADLQMASLMIPIGDLKGAKEKLTPLLSSNKTSLAKNATLRLISIALKENKADDAEKLLVKLNPKKPREEGLAKYLSGRIEFLRGNRTKASNTFQSLLATPDVEQVLSSEIFHETTLALADSLALDNNEEEGVNALLQTLEKHPNSPRLEGIFARLKKWSPNIETAPLISKLSTWVPQEDDEPKFQLIRESDSAGAFAVTTSGQILPLRALYALEFIASTNLQSPDPIVSAKGVKQIEQLQLAGEIDSPIINRSLLDLGMARLKSKSYDQAIILFDLLAESNHAPILKAYARALSGQAAFAKEKPEEASEAFSESARIASRLHQTGLQAVSELNAGISLLTTSQSKELDEMTANLKTPEAKSFLILERGLYLSTQNDPAARDLLASFLADFPDNPRKDEATLSLAESSIHTQPADPTLNKLINDEIHTLKFDLETQPLLEARRILVLLALGTGQEQASDFITKAPKHPFAPRILFQLGQAQRSGGATGKAYATFEKFLSDYPESEFTEAARYLSARSSAVSGTEAGEQNSILRYSELIENKGVLAHEAAISLASLLIDNEETTDALEKIRTQLQKTKLSDSDRRRLLILEADASGKLGEYEDVLSSYTELFKINDLPDSTYNRAYYEMGVTFEELGRNVEALNSYLTVVNRDLDPAKTTSLEWKWFDKCGIDGALALLEREKRWEAAIRLAEKIGQSNSPRAQDARESADRIRLEQRIPRE